MGREPPGSQKKKVDPTKFIPARKGGLLTNDPKEEECPYTFSDSPAYVRNKKAEEDAKRAAELEGKDETRGFLRSVEELARRQKWEEAHNILERRTAVSSGLFLVTRAVLRWKFGKYCAALRDTKEALEKYGSSAQAGPLAAAFACFARICLGSEASEKSSCSRDMRDLIEAWELSEKQALTKHVLGHGLFHPRKEERLSESVQIVDGMEATDGSYVAASGVRVGYVLLKNAKDATAPVVVHFHGNSETAADYRKPALAEKYRDLSVHLLVVDYRGYGWSGGEPSLATLLSDAEPLAEKMPEIFVQHGMAWPYPGGLILSGRSLGAQVAVHVATLFPNLFRALLLDSALATSATGDRLGRAPERSAALACWRNELEKSSLQILQPLASELCGLSTLDKIRSYDGQLLVLHGVADESVPYEGSESLHAAAGTKQKELLLIQDAGHNDIGKFEAYWSAIRRFALKVQLDDSLPSVGASVEHLCAVCAAKAVSKCGRCQKVWYCGRAHQAEHWKLHKQTCAGGPPEPKEKVTPEGDVVVWGIVIADVSSESDLQGLTACLASVAAQTPAVDALFVSWHASGELSARVEDIVADARVRHGALKVCALGASQPVRPFQRVKAVLDQAAPKDAPANAWVKVIETPAVWSERHLQHLGPALRKAEPDQRIVAVHCPSHATSQAASPSAGPLFAADVPGMLESGAVVRDAVDPVEMGLGSLTVRLKTLRAFLDATPESVLAHRLCSHRFRCKLQSAFGKKVQTFDAPDADWMTYFPAGPGGFVEEGVTAADRERGAFLHAGFTQAFPPSAETPSATAEGGEVSSTPSRHRLSAEGSAVAAAACLRRRIERQVVLAAGEEIGARELRSLAAEQMHAFLEEVGLHEVIGLERWARETSDAISSAAAAEFEVKVVAGGR